jgi:hypothetical protein
MIGIDTSNLTPAEIVKSLMEEHEMSNGFGEQSGGFLCNSWDAKPEPDAVCFAGKAF